ncbi:MAG: acetyl-CoA carboxylase biotin carboxyl carrier protein subunit [Bdellovibrionaceae bacterium]|nr:acetyl-CoA carboxylase biotin carboxyl carrier protein subunit [Pseudobdellovibrionaceae bacterium]
MILKTRVAGKDIEAPSEIVNGVLWIHHEGRTFATELGKKKKRHRAGGASGGGDLEAPMPGKVTKILKTAGESVQRGDAVLVMEAMKMEYTLKAESDSKIASIACAVGEQVTLGQTLVTFEAKAGG